MGTIGRRVRAALLTAVVAATTAVGAGGGAVPASAQAPEHTVTVTPSSGLGDTDEVSVTTTGLSTSDIFGILQCDASALGNLPSAFSGPCIIKSIRLGGGGEVDTTTIVLSGAFVAANGDTVRCGAEPGDCAIVSWSPFGWQAGVAIDMTPTPAVSARRSQEVGFPVDVIVTAPSATTDAQLAQCVLPVGPTWRRASARRRNRSPSTPAASPPCRSPWSPRSASRRISAATATAAWPSSTVPARPWAKGRRSPSCRRTGRHGCPPTASSKPWTAP